MGELVKINAISICSGIGGLDLGVKLADNRIQTVCYVEREAYAASALVARMEGSTLDKAPIWDDIATFPCEQWSGRVDLVFGGIPCQPFSCAGKQRGVEDERWLWQDFWNIVCGVGASKIFLENVPNFINHGLGELLGTLADAGWDAEWDVFSARQCGAPQLRKRFFLLANSVNSRCNRQGIPSEQWQKNRLPTGSSKGMGNTNNERLERPRAYKQCADKLFTWPPGPTEHEQWQHIEPDLKPAICRVANGTTQRLDSPLLYRQDRLRCLGNAVVPITAALAYSVLSKRLI